MSEEITKTPTEESKPKVDVVVDKPAAADAPKVDEAKAEPAKVEEPAPKVEEIKKEEAAIVPEKYDLKLPEKSSLNPEAIEKISTFAKANGLTQSQAQAILERDNQIEAGRPEALKQQQKQLSESWKNLSHADKELGGENFTQTVSHAQRALKQFGNDNFTKIVDESGLGNHPEVLRFMARVGKAIGNDSFIHGDTASPKKEKSIAEKWFPDMAKAQK